MTAIALQHAGPYSLACRSRGSFGIQSWLQLPTTKVRTTSAPIIFYGEGAEVGHLMRDIAWMVHEFAADPEAADASSVRPE